MTEQDSQPDREQLPLEVEQQIDRLSDEFERAWRTGHAPHIEDYAGRVSEIRRASLIKELLVVEIDLRQQAGERVDLEAYRQRFSDDGTVVDAALAVLERRRAGRAETEDQPRHTLPQQREPDPTHIDRFEIRCRLGGGGYGVVYLAHDPNLDRLVALKVPSQTLLRSGQQRESFLHEARTAAKLKHAALVTVYEVQQEGDLIYIVQEYIEGQNLAQWASAHQRSWQEITHRLIEIATAIGYVHQQGFYHRDLKPGNILIDNEGHAHVADFGLAVHEDALRVLKGHAAGTPQYMSPEQVRGESHWIDNRTDIWALGVILYELLAGHRPFTAADRLELFEEIQERDPKSPRTRNPDIPKELERICLKCLAKRRTHRYANTSDLLEDLQSFLGTCLDSEAANDTGKPVESRLLFGANTPAAGSTVGADGDCTPRPSARTSDSGSQPPLKIVPKGLRSFDKEDKEFFLELLPGPRDREGLPDSIRFWKTRIEERDSDATFPVGVMYGPSGCGKSSLVKAGLLPHLASDVLPVYVEATPADTELRLLKALRKQIPTVAPESSLVATLAGLRTGRMAGGRKVLLVLDQFEQWLHGTTNMDNSQLVRALRHCDGANVQCLVLVRDDFWLSTTRLMQALEILQIEGTNSAVVDLFDPSHARKVLRAFGLAYGRLPEHDLSADEQRFLDRAVQDLTHDGKVICVQLSLLADMMKGRPWTPASLQEVGGTFGVGVAFLDETFTARTAPPTHRLHAKAAQAVLKTLLPAVGADIKGQMKSAEELRKCSGYAERPEEFANLLTILNVELRLITPTEPEVAEAGAEFSSAEKYYQLTHDYLVPSLRDWLTRKQKETRRGRAELVLAERSSLWNAKPETRYLPSAWEFARILLLAPRCDWAEPARKMMYSAGRYHTRRWSAGILVVALLGFGLQFLVYFVRSQSEAVQLRDAVTAMKNSRGRAVASGIDLLSQYDRDQVCQKLKTEFAEPANSADDRLALALALAEFGHVNHPFLLEVIPEASSAECGNIIAALGKGDHTALKNDIHEAAALATSRHDWRWKTRLATVALYMKDVSIASEMLHCKAAPPMQSETVQPASDPWQDTPLRPPGGSVDAATKTAIADGHGIVEDRFAICLDLGAETFLSVNTALTGCRYRPIRVRPFLHAGTTKVSAVWTRDGRRGDLEFDREERQLPAPFTRAEKDGLVPEDFACYETKSGQRRYCIAWGERDQTEEDRCISLDSRNSYNTDFYSQCTVQMYVSENGFARNAMVLSNQQNRYPSLVDVGPSLPTDLPNCDIAVVVAREPADSLDACRSRVAAINALPEKERSEPRIQRDLADNLYELGLFAEALVVLDGLRPTELESSSNLAQSIARLRAFVLARLGQANEAKAALDEHRRLAEADGNLTRIPYEEVLVLNWLGETDAAIEQFGTWVSKFEGDAYFYQPDQVAKMAAQLASGLQKRDEAAADAMRSTALKFLRQHAAVGHSDSADYRTDADFASISHLPEFQELCPVQSSSITCMGLWKPLAPHDYRIVLELGVEAAFDRCQELSQDGFRPVAVSVGCNPNKTKPMAAAIWHRPNDPSLYPVQRTMFIELFSQWCGDLEELAESLSDETDGDTLSGICLAVGSAVSPSDTATTAWKDKFSRLYVNRPEPGVHSASGWALRNWKLPMPEIHPSQNSRDGFRWQKSKLGLTLIHVKPGQFVRHRRRDDAWRQVVHLRHGFWMSDREIPWSLFREFLADQQAERPEKVEEVTYYNGDSDSEMPVQRVSWYSAVLFCNWLSGKEGLQPAYIRTGNKERLPRYAGFTLSDYDEWRLIEANEGYRLPTEAQWEYACRAGTTTAFFFGDDERFLDAYDVYVRNANNRPERAGSRRCSPWGFFDMYGNVNEWCHDWHRYPRNSDNGVVVDPVGPERGFQRIVRGGDYSGTYESLIDSFNNCQSPDAYSSGFRVARPVLSPERGLDAASYNHDTVDPQSAN